MTFLGAKLFFNEVIKIDLIIITAWVGWLVNRAKFMKEKYECWCIWGWWWWEDIFHYLYIYNAQMFVLIGVLIGRYIFFLICELIHDFNRGILLFLSFVSMWRELFW